MIDGKGKKRGGSQGALGLDWVGVFVWISYSAESLWRGDGLLLRNHHLGDKIIVPSETCLAGMSCRSLACWEGRASHRSELLQDFQDLSCGLLVLLRPLQGLL